MDLKNRIIEASNYLIMSEQSNVEFLGKEICDEDFVLKNACFYSIFPFCPLLKITYFHVPK